MMKQRIIIGIILVLLGIAICATGIGVHVAYLHERYQGFAGHGYYASFADYYWEVGKANLVFSVLIGILQVGVGIYLLCTKPWWYVPAEESLK